MEKIPVIRLLHLSEAQKKAYRIADNKITENGKWSIELLQFEFKEIEKLDLDLPLNITGFNFTEIDMMLDGEAKETDIESNSVPFIASNEVVSKNGDMWLLGKHKIICGNALEESTYAALLENKKADMIFTDPPYNLDIKDICGNGNIKHENFKFASGEMNSDDFIKFLNKSLSLLKAFSNDGSLHYICMDWRHIQELLAATTNIYELKNLCIWNKNNAGMGSLYRSKHELVFLFKHGSKPHINNMNLGKDGRNRSNVWNYSGVNSFGKEQKNLHMHPTVKPVEMIKDAILDVTNRGSVVLDNFLGSGSTLIAAEKSGRICYGIEIEPIYIDTTIRRYEAVTGKDAIHCQSKRTYKALLSERSKVNEK